MTARCLDWEAWYNQMPGADHDVLHVAGRCEVESSSIELRLEPDNEGIVDEPDLFVVRLVVERPDFGDTMMTTKDVGGQWHETGIERVVVRLPDGTAETVSVGEAS